MAAPPTSEHNVPSNGNFSVRLPKFPFVVRLWAALAIFTIASLVTIFQSTRPDAFRPPRFLSQSWFRYPLEWNAPSRLPKIGVTLIAIQGVPGTNHVWAVGKKGMVVSSTDGGQTWQQTGIQEYQVAPRSSPETPEGQFPQDQRKPTATPTGQSISQGTNAPFPAPTPTSTPTPTPSSTSSVENAWLIAVHFEDANHGLAVSDTGTTFETWSRGEGWSWEEHGLIPLRSDDPFNEKEWKSLQITQANHREFAGVVPLGDIDSSFELFSLEIVDNAIPTAVHFLNNGKTVWVLGWYYGSSDLWRTQDGGNNWDHWRMNEPVLMQKGLYFSDQSRGWVVGGYGGIRASTDSGLNWKPQTSGTLSHLNAVQFLPDGQNGWIAGDDGLILSTNDGGATWVHRTQGREASGRYLRFPAPWYFLILLLIGLTLVRRTQTALPEPEESVADVLVSDRPLDTSAGDVLAFNSIAVGLSRFLRNENTMPPLTIAIIGEWGTGKSSLMNLLRADLRSYKFRPVWFNAWHHQKEEHMLASLLENIKLQAVPRWWSNRGLAFRAKLLGIRGWRHWLPLVVLLFFIYVLLIYHFGREGTDASYAGLMGWLTAAVTHPLDTASNLVPFVPLLAGIFAFLGAVWRGITAFGVKPASLLAGVSAGASIRGLEAQTSFRQKFAVQFNDVTRALGKRSLLIFIDDLDRCRPENVLETLEAVNFLTTSGECFVVVGMAREYVERCVGRAFKDIAEEMIDDVDKPQSANGEDQSPGELAKEKRIKFAQQYLDKLINIEVPIPVAKQGQSLKLLLAGAYQPSEAKPKSRWQEFKSSFSSALARHWRVLPALAAVAMLLTLGYFLAMSLIAQSPGSPATTQVSATPNVSPSPPQTPTPTPPPSAVTSSRTPTPTPTALPRPSPSPTAETIIERAEIIAGGRALFSRGFLPAIALLGILWFGATILTRRPDLVVKDSPNFVDALRIWHPLIYSRQSTPRTIKRFMNRIRYLAMRQRPMTQGERSWWRRLFRSSEGSKELPSEAAASAAVIPVDPIPDEALVALAAIEHFDNRLFHRFHEESSEFSPDIVDRPDGSMSFSHNLLSTALMAHNERFGRFDGLKYRDRFREMAASVEVR